MFGFLRFLPLAIVFMPLSAQAFQLGTYLCAVHTAAAIQGGADGGGQITEIAPEVQNFTVKLEPYKPHENCNAIWGRERHPHECRAQFQARFDPPLLPHEPVLYGMDLKEPDVYFGKAGYIHFTDNILFHASWSRYGAAVIAKGKCDRRSVTND